MNSKPTEIDNNGTKIWKNSEGQFHRDNDLPAIVRVDNICWWYQNGKLHRDSDKPAVMDPYAGYEWHQNSKLHRDGNLPAIVHMSGGHCEWWRNDKCIKKMICTEEAVEIYKKPHPLINKSKRLSTMCQCDIIYLWNYGHEPGCPLRK